MRNPTVKQIQKVIDGLKRIEVQANVKDAFDIDEPDVYNKNTNCGTIHCVAGWYAVANKRCKPISKAIHDGYCDYEDGAELMATHLGFNDSLELENWAENNEKLWGNGYGGDMFCITFAYNNLKTSSTDPMTIIIDHWEGVQDRVAAL